MLTDGSNHVALKVGNKHVVVPNAEMEEFKAKLEPVFDRWIADVKKRGIDGRTLVNVARKRSPSTATCIDFGSKHVVTAGLVAGS